eukprot:CAMPEP_0195285972 /NCGR_PEP_ID=MMETSP0707-20130614/3606_1 /TAXON_ID=33640 /ORGANISM="Asterionellopsis glacialis, Strain CCMP134" /LENGTH=517 /DNA_ID=CAMNT_0040345549 /DNA_START=206 /DNA_END=1759 /DNA_ORIENTATION=-
MSPFTDDVPVDESSSLTSESQWKRKGQTRTKTKTTSESSCADASTFRIFLFVCLSMACRSFEAGIISSMIPEIKHDLQFDYVTQGQIAASPDYGIVPGGIMAIVVFQYWEAYPCLVVVMVGTSLATFACVLHPSRETLIMARAVGGFFWAHAATLYPVWIDQHGGSVRTMWLAGMNVSLLVGILTGYVVGGVSQAYSWSTTWVELYFVEGCLMLACGILLVTCCDKKRLQINSSSHNKMVHDAPAQHHLPQFLSVVQGDENEDGEGKQQPNIRATSEEIIVAEKPSVWELLSMLPQSIPFIFAVCILATTAGCTCFALYFVTQVCRARGFDEQEAIVTVASVFTTAPILGMVSGSWITAKLGGYHHHASTFGVALVAALGTLMSSVAFVGSRSYEDASSSNHIPFIVAAWLFFFCGAVPASTLNGVVVSAVPHGAAHVASGIQFAFINSAKILIPPMGGRIVDDMGLIVGFDMTTIVCSIVFVILSVVGVVHARSSHPKRTVVQPSPASEDGYSQIP